MTEGVLDQWLDQVRLFGAAVDIDPEAAETANDVVAAAARDFAVALDTTTLRTMAMTLFTVQAIHVIIAPVAPGEDGFEDTCVAACALLANTITARLDGGLT